MGSTLLDPKFIDVVKFVSSSEGVPNLSRIASEVIKRTNQVPPTNFDGLSKESLQNTLLRTFDPETNDAKELMQRFSLSDTVASKLVKTFIELEDKRTEMKLLILKRVKDAITDAVDRHIFTLLAEKMHVDDKSTAQPSVKGLKKRQ